ncbi:unnamed protein product [Cyprideis torosa]|uniref:Uncharacterized protein n=1 Tax=Cyprideis torosa TaxID=163714 RepID=A0A7R8WAH7_9CRUS|nr:unnamed protein product [Cyprideis torosa]CAG0891044.1 unnamed protein product [Cyprideis torosa]
MATAASKSVKAEKIPVVVVDLHPRYDRAFDGFLDKKSNIELTDLRDHERSERIRLINKGLRSKAAFLTSTGAAYVRLAYPFIPATQIVSTFGCVVGNQVDFDHIFRKIKLIRQEASREESDCKRTLEGVNAWIYPSDPLELLGDHLEKLGACVGRFISNFLNCQDMMSRINQQENRVLLAMAYDVKYMRTELGSTEGSDIISVKHPVDFSSIVKQILRTVKKPVPDNQSATSVSGASPTKTNSSLSKINPKAEKMKVTKRACLKFVVDNMIQGLGMALKDWDGYDVELLRNGDSHVTAARLFYEENRLIISRGKAAHLLNRMVPLGVCLKVPSTELSVDDQYEFVMDHLDFEKGRFKVSPWGAVKMKVPGADGVRVPVQQFKAVVDVNLRHLGKLLKQEGADVVLLKSTEPREICAVYCHEDERVVITTPGRFYNMICKMVPVGMCFNADIDGSKEEQMRAIFKQYNVIHDEDSISSDDSASDVLARAASQISSAVYSRSSTQEESSPHKMVNDFLAPKNDLTPASAETNFEVVPVKKESPVEENWGDDELGWADEEASSRSVPPPEGIPQPPPAATGVEERGCPSSDFLVQTTLALAGLASSPHLPPELDPRTEVIGRGSSPYSGTVSPRPLSPVITFGRGWRPPMHSGQTKETRPGETNYVRPIPRNENRSKLSSPDTWHYVVTDRELSPLVILMIQHGFSASFLRNLSPTWRPPSPDTTVVFLHADPQRVPSIIQNFDTGLSEQLRPFRIVSRGSPVLQLREVLTAFWSKENLVDLICRMVSPPDSSAGGGQPLGTGVDNS